MIFRQKAVALIWTFVLMVALVLGLGGCARPAANPPKPPIQEEQPAVTTTPVTPNPPPQKGLIVRAEDLNGAKGGARSARLDRPQEVYESLADAIRLDLSGDFSFNQEDLAARIKVEPKVAYRIEVVQEPWAAITIPLTKEVIRVTIAAKPTEKGQPFDYDRAIEIRRGQPRALQISSPQYPEVRFPGGYGVPSGRTKLDFVFSHPVDRKQFEQTVNQIVPMTAYTWTDDQHVRVEFELLRDNHLVNFSGSQFSDKGGVPFVADALQLRSVSERKVRLVTGPEKSRVLPSLDSLVLGAWLSPDGRQLLHARSQIEMPGEGPPWASLWQRELVTGQQREIVASLAVYPPSGGPSWTHGGEYWLLPGHGLGLDSKAHLYGAQGRELKVIPTAVTSEQSYRLRCSTLSPMGDTFAYLVMDTKQVKKGPQPADLSPNTLHIVSTVDGTEILKLPDAVWSQNYEKTWRPRLLTYTPDGQRIIVGGWQPDEQGRWTPQFREIDIASGSVSVRSDLPNPFLTDKGELYMVNPAYAWDYLLYAPTGNRYLVKSNLGLKLVDSPNYGRISERVSPPTYEIRGTAGEVLATVQVDAMQIVWAPDGKRIAFLDNGSASHGRKLWVFDLETKQLTAWTEQDVAFLAGWGPDGIVVVEDAPRGE
ncbi:MAG: hypothetical protein ACM3ZQ_08850 [Bacillota bacterium]